MVQVAGTLGPAPETPAPAQRPAGGAVSNVHHARLTVEAPVWRGEDREGRNNELFTPDLIHSIRNRLARFDPESR